MWKAFSRAAYCILYALMMIPNSRLQNGHLPDDLHLKEISTLVYWQHFNSIGAHFERSSCTKLFATNEKIRPSPLLISPLPPATAHCCQKFLRSLKSFGERGANAQFGSFRVGVSQKSNLSARTNNTKEDRPLANFPRLSAIKTDQALCAMIGVAIRPRIPYLAFTIRAQLELQRYYIYRDIRPRTKTNSAGYSSVWK